jgi:hypothetical protein
VPRVDDRYIESLEVARIARGDRGTPRLRNAGNQRVAQVGASPDALALGG